MDVRKFEDEAACLPLERLGAEITTLAGHLAAACRWLLLVAEFDRREGWGQWGCWSASPWLGWKCGLELRAAQEKVRVARALHDRPIITDAFAKGELSYSQARTHSGGRARHRSRFAGHGPPRDRGPAGAARAGLPPGSARRGRDRSHPGSTRPPLPLLLLGRRPVVGAFRSHRTRVEIHHRKPWADGGATDLDNLDPLCPYHHWLVHEGGWSVVRDGSGRVVFRRPDGTVLDAGHARAGPHDGEVERRNFVAGITITPTTVQTAWRGEPLNLGWAVADILRTREKSTPPNN